MIELKKFQGENEEQFIWRLGMAKDSGELEMDWNGIADIVNREFRENEEEYRNESAYRKPYQQAKRFYEKNVFQDLTSEAYIKLLKEEQKSLIIEKQKLRDEKLEYSRWLREYSRDELIAEHIYEAIKDLPKLEIPNIIFDENTTEKAGVLLIADAHYGAELKINGLFGEVINEYSPEIFEKRMWDLLKQTVNICEKEGFNTLNVYNLGDNISGMLRVSQLMKLRYGIIESTVNYGRFITEWLNELTKYVKVNFQMVFDSNHDQLRLLGCPKNTFPNENVSVIITEKIMDRLGDNPNFTFVKNPTGYIFDNDILGFSILGLHGECKSLSQAIKDFTSTYNVKIDILVGGHKHHGSNEQVGLKSDVVHAPSLIGVDDYSMSLHKTSDPGATLIVIERNKGKSIEYNIKL